MGIGQRCLLFYMMVHIETAFDIFSKKKKYNSCLKRKEEKKKGLHFIKEYSSHPPGSFSALLFLKALIIFQYLTSFTCLLSLFHLT